MGKEDIGKVIKVMGYRPPGMYERCELVKTTTGIYIMPDGRDPQLIENPDEVNFLENLLSMQNPHKIQC